MRRLNAERRFRIALAGGEPGQQEAATVTPEHGLEAMRARFLMAGKKKG